MNESILIKYEGLFFEGEDENIIHLLESKRLGEINDILHVTFLYRLQNEFIFNEIVGQEFEISLTDYGNDGNNSGFLIKLPEELLKYYKNTDVNNGGVVIPHITASLASDAKAMDTKYLNFEPLVKPIKVKGKFGFWIKNGEEEYVSYEKIEK